MERIAGQNKNKNSFWFIYVKSFKWLQSSSWFNQFSASQSSTAPLNFQQSVQICRQASVCCDISPTTGSPKPWSGMMAHRYRGDDDKCHRWRWVCYGQEMPFSPVPQQRCSPRRSQSLVKWFNLHIHMHVATRETACICWSGSAAALVDVQTGCP